VTVDLDGLLGRPGAIGGDIGGVGPLDREACRRLACDGAVTRVVVSRHPGHQPVGHHPEGGSVDDHPSGHPDLDHGPSDDLGADDPSDPAELQGRLQAAMALLPPTLGGAPSQPLEVGRATRVVQPAQRRAGS